MPTPPAGHDSLDQKVINIEKSSREKVIMKRKSSILTQDNSRMNYNFQNQFQTYRPVSNSYNNNQISFQRNNSNRFNKQKSRHVKSECYCYIKRCQNCRNNHSKINGNNYKLSNPNKRNKLSHNVNKLNKINCGYEGPSDNNDWETEKINSCYEFVNDMCVLNNENSLAKNNHFIFEFEDNDKIINSLESWLTEEDDVFLDLNFNEKELRLFLDCSASYSVIRVGLAKKLGLKLKKLDATMQGIGCGEFKVFATTIFHPNIRLTDDILTLKCLVVEGALDTPGDVLMGIKDFNSNGLLVDQRTKTIRVNYPDDHPKCHNHILNSNKVNLPAISINTIKVHVDPRNNHDKRYLALTGEMHDNCVPGVTIGPNVMRLYGHYDILVANLNDKEITLSKGQKLTKYVVLKDNVLDSDIKQLVNDNSEIIELNYEMINNDIEIIELIDKMIDDDIEIIDNNIELIEIIDEPIEIIELE